MEAASLILSIEYGSILFQSGEKQKATILTIANKNTVHSWDLPPGNDGLESILCLPWLYIYMQHYIYCSDYDYWKGVAFFLPGDFHCNPRFLNSTEAVVSINLLGMCAWFFFSEQLMQFRVDPIYIFCSGEGRLYSYIMLLLRSFNKDYHGRFWPSSRNCAIHCCQPLPTGIIGIAFWVRGPLIYSNFSYV